MSASRSPPSLPNTPTSPKTRPLSLASRSRSCRAARCLRRTAGRVRRRSFDRARHLDKRLWRSRRRVRRRGARHRARSLDRAPFGRAARDPRCACALRPARDVLELYGAAKVPHRTRDTLAAFSGAPDIRSSERRPHRRRVRHPRRALSRRRARLRRGAQIRSPGEMDRGPPRASDGRQPFARAAPSRARRSRCATAACSRSKTSSSTARAPISARMACACRSHQLDGARPLSRARLSLDRAFPPHQQDARRDLSRTRPLRGHLRARALDGCDRGQARHRPHRNPPPQHDRRAARCRSPAR